MQPRETRKVSTFLHTVCCLHGMAHRNELLGSELHRQVNEQARVSLGQALISSPLTLEEINAMLLMSDSGNAPNSVSYSAYALLQYKSLKPLRSLVRSTLTAGYLLATAQNKPCSVSASRRLSAESSAATLPWTTTKPSIYGQRYACITYSKLAGLANDRNWLTVL